MWRWCCWGVAIVSMTAAEPPSLFSVAMAVGSPNVGDELAEELDRVGCELAAGVTVTLPSGLLPRTGPVPAAAVEELAGSFRWDRFAADSRLAPVAMTIKPVMAEGSRVGHQVWAAFTLRTRLSEHLAERDDSDRLGLGPVDAGGAARPLTVEEVFIHSSNIGAGLIALEIGAEVQRDFLHRLGLLAPLETEAGSTATPQLPEYWGRAAVATIAFGHGIAVTPLHFARAGAILVNGGREITPSFFEERLTNDRDDARVVSEATSAEIRRLMRLNVIHRNGSGRRADVPGYRVGGKTGTADLAAGGAYDGRAVVTSFFAAFPMDEPSFVVLVTLYDPKDVGRFGSRTAGMNAAPTAGRIIARSAPLLGVAKR